MKSRFVCRKVVGFTPLMVAVFSGILHWGCLFTYRQRTDVGGLAEPKVTTFIELGDIHPKITAKLGVSALRLPGDGRVLVGSNFGLVSVNTRGPSELIQWDDPGDVVEQIGVDPSSSSIWIYHRSLGVLQQFGNDWHVRLTVENGTESRGDQFRVPAFVFVDDGLYLTIPRSILHFDKDTAKFSQIKLPDVECENYPKTSDSKMSTYESRCLVSAGSLSGKLAVIERSFPVLSNITQNEPFDSDFMFDRIFVWDRDAWTCVFDGTNGKYFFEQILSDGENAMALTNTGKVGVLTGNNNIRFQPGLDNVIGISSSSTLGPIAITSDGNVVPVNNPTQILLSTGEVFKDEHARPVIASIGNSMAVSWVSDDCIYILTGVIGEATKQTQKLCK